MIFKTCFESPARETNLYCPYNTYNIYLLYVICIIYIKNNGKRLVGQKLIKRRSGFVSWAVDKLNDEINSLKSRINEYENSPKYNRNDYYL
jgi:hypothetical protein